ncbi:MAG TPA: ABC transporter substrate-binding protein [Candidatus Gracilibacteria bacterium]
MRTLLRTRTNGLLPRYSRRIILVIFVLLIGLFFLWGRFFKAFSSIQPATGGVYTESIVGRIYNLNPLAPNATAFDQDLHKLIFEGLLEYNPKTGQIEDGLAEFRIGDDGKSYEMVLKQSARFSDGQKVTIDDILFTFEEIIQNPHFQNENLNKAFEYVTIDVLDERTIKFTLPEQNVFFLSYLATPILPRKYFKGALIEEVLDPNYAFNLKPVGAGPYKLKTVIPERNGSYRVFLEPNEDYYGAAPFIRSLVFYVYPDIEKLKAGQNESTVISKIPSQFEKVIQSQLSTEYEKKIYILPRYLGIFFNLDKPIAQKLALRKALYVAVNKESLLAKEEGWQRIESPFFFEGIETSFQVRNATQARQILRSSGFPYSRDLQIRTDGVGGNPVILNMVTSTSPAVYSRMAQSVAREWEDQLDVQINVKVLNPKEFQDALKTRDYDILFFGTDFSENFDSLSSWHSSQTNKLNFSNLTRDDVDFMIGEIRFTGAQSDFFALSQKLDELVPVIPIATPQYFTLIAKDVKGWEDSFGKLRRYADRFHSINQWYFIEEPAWNLGDKSKVWTFVKWIFGQAKP